MSSIATPQLTDSAAATAPAKRTLPDSIERRGINEAQWRTLCNSLYPGADPNSVLLVVDYCHARKLDPLKKPCHIVPMQVRDAKTGQYVWRDVVLPGIYEYRTTAMRTGLYLGHSRPEFGPEIDYQGVTAPEWCEMTFFRALSREHPDIRIEFPVRLYFREVVNTKKDGKPNDRWTKAPRQMLLKCTEAAGLREAFPDELGGEPVAEEIEGRELDAGPHAAPAVLPAQRKSAALPPSPPAEPIEAAETRAAEPVEASSSRQPSTSSREPLPLAEALARSPIGRIAGVHVRDQGAVVELETGYRAVTRDTAIREAAQQLHSDQQVVELVTRPSRDPSRFAPTIVEILVIGEAVL